MTQKVINATDKFGEFFGISYEASYVIIGIVWMLTVGMIIIAGPDVWAKWPAFASMVACLFYMHAADPYALPPQETE